MGNKGRIIIFGMFGLTILMLLGSGHLLFPAVRDWLAVRQFLKAARVECDRRAATIEDFALHSIYVPSENFQKELVRLQNHENPAIAVQALVSCLEEPDAELQKLGAYCLGTMGSRAEGAIPALLRALEDSNVEPYIHLALGAVSRDATEQLAASYATGSPVARAHIIELLGFRRERAAIAFPIVLAGLSDKDQRVRLAAYQAIAGFPCQAQPAVPLLRELFASETADVRLYIAAALWEVAEDRSSHK